MGLANEGRVTQITNQTVWVAMKSIVIEIAQNVMTLLSKVVKTCNKFQHSPCTKSSGSKRQASLAMKGGWTCDNDLSLVWHAHGDLMPHIRQTLQLPILWRSHIARE